MKPAITATPVAATSRAKICGTVVLQKFTPNNVNITVARSIENALKNKSSASTATMIPPRRGFVATDKSERGPSWDGFTPSAIVPPLAPAVRRRSHVIAHPPP